MGKLKKLYRAKRALALVLAATMAFTMIPSTALAAPADDDAPEFYTDSAAASEETGMPADETVDAAADAEASTGGGTVTGDEAAGNEASTEDTGGASGTGDGAEADPAGSSTEPQVSPAAETAKPVYKIITDGLDTNFVFTGSPVFDLSGIELQRTLNGQSEDVDASAVTSVWQAQGADGNYTVMATGTEPVNAGKYRAVFSFAKEDGVHDGAEATVDFTIEKASVVIRLKPITVKPGTAKEAVKVEIDQVTTASGTSDSFSADDIKLEIAGLRDAITGSTVSDGEKLKKDGDYVLDVIPSFKADASEARKAVYANYNEPEQFTADIVMGELAETRINVTLASKWQEAGKVTLKSYDEKPAEAPALDADYTLEVQYLDDTKGWTLLEGAAAPEGAWVDDESGEPADAPTDAGEYIYRFTYKDSKGEYAESTVDITVVIAPAPVTVEIANSSALRVPEDTALTKVLSQVDYKVFRTDNEEKKTEIIIAQSHIWGTGYDDSNVTQIYEPLFTLQVRTGDAYKDIEDPDYRLRSGNEYRVIYKGEKAIYNADGSYGHRTGINSGLEEDGEEINGMNPNYVTDETPTPDNNALVIEVQAGTEMEWDVSGLYSIGGPTPEEAKARDYDNTPLYSSRSGYKNGVKLKGSGKSLDGVGEDFTYTWYRHTEAEDLLDKEIIDQNQANGFRTDGFDDADKWESVDESSFYLGNRVSPVHAGIYKLEIGYEDNTDDGTYYYVKDQKPAVVYYVINKIALQIVPEGTYEVLSGRSVGQFFAPFEDEDIPYELKTADGAPYNIPSGVYPFEPYWTVVEKTKQGDTGESVQTGRYGQFDYDQTLTADEKITYEIQADDIREVDSDSIGYYDYTTNKSVKAEINAPNAAGQKEVERIEEPLGGTVSLTVKPMGTAKLNVAAVDASKVVFDKIYDGTSVEINLADLVRITSAENQEIPAAGLEGLISWCELSDGSESNPSEYTKEAGEYNIYVYFEGNETYAPLEAPVLIGTGKITKRPITVSAKLPASYETLAGMSPDEIYDNLSVSIDGYVADEENAFTVNRYDEGIEIPAWGRRGYSSPVFRIYEKGNREPLEDNAVLRRHKNYEVHYDAAENQLSSDCEFWNNRIQDWVWLDAARNYEVITTAAEVLDEFYTVTRPSDIASISEGTVSRLAIADPAIERDQEDNVTQTISVLEGIDYSGYELPETYDGKQITGNLVAFRVYAPAEFEGSIPATAMFRNEIEKNGGYVVEENAGYFVVLFDAKGDIAEGTSEWNKSFSVRWEDKYIETFVFKFKESQMLGDLTDAAVPKTLAFNAPEKKMAVGSTQQLDVKIKKAQMGDVICLGYISSDDKILRVNENGNVTALKKGKATITVYAQHKDETGEMTPIMDAKGNYAKSANVVIEAAAVTAPKPVKVTAHGTYADLSYTTPKDGYRREIYVVDNMKNPGLKKAADIESQVKAMKNDQWKGTFAIAPVYLDRTDERLNTDRNHYTVRLSGLSPVGQYTVYVRNVCAARTLADGSVITLDTVNESASGTAVSFKTLKSEMLDLHLSINEWDKNGDQIEGITDLTTEEDFDDPTYIGHRYQIELAKLTSGSIDCQAFGRYLRSVIDPASDKWDYHYIQVPFNKKDTNYKTFKDNYEEPKLEYALKYWDEKIGEYAYGAKNEYASIDKKGRIKITGVNNYSSSVVVRVKDKTTGYAAYAELYIVAGADSVTAKKKSINLPVGQEVDLNDDSLYTYTLGKKKLTAYNWPSMVDEDVRNAVKAKEDYFTLDQYGNLRAVKEGGILELTLTDSNVKNIASDPNKAVVKITFKSTALTPVKNLKAYDVIHDRFGLTFKHAGGADAFRVEITDGSGRKIYDRRYTASSIYEPKEDIYRITPGQITARLAKESQYKVEVTALYDTVTSKPTSVKVKTTKIPACVNYLDSIEMGGMEILVSEDHESLNDDNMYLDILSGNAYTLTAKVTYNRGRVNDTLVWSVSNGKVASVKAAAGSYCITLRGLKPGAVTLEVKSKILGNKVVARYGINVVAVGDAYKGSNRYYGDNEPKDWRNPYLDNGRDNAPEYLPLSVGDLRKVTQIRSNQEGQYGYSLFSFTAPETGRYQLVTEGYARYSNNPTTITLYKTTTKGVLPTNRIGYGSADLGWLTKDETIYIRSSHTSGSYTTDNSYYIGVELTQKMTVLDASGTATVVGQGRNEYFQFTASENAYYQFSAVNGQNQSQYMQLYLDEQSAINGRTPEQSGNGIEYLLQSGDSVWISVYLNRGEKYTFGAEKISEDAALNTPIPVMLGAGGTKYLMFDIAKDGYYKFTSTADTANSDVYAEMSVNGNVTKNQYSSVFEIREDLKQGDAVCLKVTNNGSAETSFQITAAEIEIQNVPASGTSIASGSDNFYKFTAPKAGAYKFSLTSASSDMQLKIWNSMTDAETGYGEAASADSQASEDGSSYYCTVGMLLEAGQTVYVNPVNNTGSELTVTMGSAEDSIPVAETGKGTKLTLAANEPSRVIFTAPETGIYVFTTGEVSGDTSFSWYRSVYTGSDQTSESATVSNGASLDKKLALQAGQTIICEIESGDAGNVVLNIALSAVFKELKAGTSASVSLQAGEADGFLFKAPSAGYYTFWTEGTEDTYGILCEPDEINLDTCLSHNNRTESGALRRVDSGGPNNDGGDNFAIVYELQAGQVVYLKVMDYFDDRAASFSVHVAAGQKSFN